MRRRRTRTWRLGLLLVPLLAGCRESDAPLDQRVQHGYAENEGVRLHYVTLGRGPLLVLLHGFPDYWYTWHNQLDALARNHRVAALDLRGYNLSDKPQGVESYALDVLAADVASLIRHLGEERATIVGHDWGGMVAWHMALYLPELVEGLVVLNAPQPQALKRELARNPLQRKRSAYAQQFMRPGAEAFVSNQLEGFLFWAEGEEERGRHLEALGRSDLQALLNYYLANYPRKPYAADPAGITPVRAPVLVIHGVEDHAFAPQTLNGSFAWSEQEVTLVVFQGAGHWIQHERAEQVSRILVDWLARQAGPHEAP